MTSFYDDFLKRNSWSDINIHELLDGKTTDIDVVVDSEEVRFCIVDKKSREELLVIDKVLVSRIREIKDKPVKEAVEANAVAIIIYDKLVGDDNENNPARAKGGLWFDEQVRRLVIGKDDTVVFCTHNPGKIQSANKYFDGVVQFETVDYEIPEIRGSIEEIAVAKVKDAFKRTGKPTIAMDAGFEVASLNNFPGSYVNHMLETIGIDGILNLMSGIDNRECEFTQCLAYYDGSGEPIVFHGSHKGVLSREKRGTISADDWSDISLIFIPAEEIMGKERTLAELNHEERIALTKRNDNVSNSAFKAFKEWFIERKS